MIIQNISGPRVMGAACAAVNQITAISNSRYKFVLVQIANGTYQVRTCASYNTMIIIFVQVVNGLKFDILIMVALSTTCNRDSELCTSVQCPIDERTKSLWMASVVAPPTPINQTINYMVLNVSQAMHISTVSVQIINKQHKMHLGLFILWQLLPTVSTVRSLEIIRC